MRRLHLTLLALCALPALAQARLENCDINGESVNPNNGHTTAGKTGMMRCRDRDTGTLVREQEIRGGKFEGVVRYYSDKGELQRVTFYGDDGREQAHAEFTSQGQLRAWRAAPHGRPRSWRQARLADGNHRRRWRRAPFLQQRRDRLSELSSEQQWYLNGQLRLKHVYERSGGQVVRNETRYHDNGRVSSEGQALLLGRHEEQLRGVYRFFDDEGRLRGESFFNDRGRLTRERELDENGKVKRDDAVFEDGSRKAFSTRPGG